MLTATRNYTTAEELAAEFGNMVLAFDHGDYGNVVAIVVGEQAVKAVTLSPWGGHDEHFAAFTDSLDLAHYLSNADDSAITGKALLEVFNALVEAGIVERGTRRYQEVAATLCYVDSLPLMRSVGLRHPGELLPIFTGELDKIDDPKLLGKLLTLLAVGIAGRPAQ